MEQNATPPRPEAATDEPASSFKPFLLEAEERSVAQELTAFDPVPLRYRADGLTPAKQREFVEALADCGIVRVAAARIGVSEQAVALLIYLLGKTEHLVEPPEQSEAVADNWQQWMDAMEQSLPPPELPAPEDEWGRRRTG